MVTKVFPNATVVPKRIFDDIKWPKRICLDIDGVICEYDFPKIVKNFFGVDLSSAAIFAYDLADVLGVSPGLINTMFREQVWGKPNFVPGALETIREWEAKGYELVIYSNRIKYMGETGLKRWLREWGIPFKCLHEEIKANSYSDYVVTPNYDVHIDDSPSKLMSTNSNIKLLFSQPWNEKCLNITEELVRVKSWQEVSKYV